MSLNAVEPSEYPERSLPRHSTHNAKRNRAGSVASSADHRLSIIAEDSNHAPHSPLPTIHQTHNRPFHRRFLGDPPRYRDGKEPPKYTLWDVTGPKGEKLEDLRNNPYIARRGGWKRICLIAVIVIACIVALAVGLAVGLHKKHDSSTPTPSPSASSSPSTGPFPAGSYTLQTFLSTTSTNCTSNPASWTCHPSVTYATSPTDSLATFNWVISSSSNNNFTISSTDNPFAIDFKNATLILHDANTENERYSFTSTVQKQVFPTLDVICYYNDTQFTANMYTKKPKSYPAGDSASPSSSPAAAGGAAFVNWNFAVDATESIGGGVDVPDCYNWDNGQAGSRATDGYSPQPAADFCSCAYKNYDP